MKKFDAFAHVGVISISRTVDLLPELIVFSDRAWELLDVSGMHVFCAVICSGVWQYGHGVHDLHVCASVAPCPLRDRPV